jgi:hypothetical protein
MKLKNKTLAMTRSCLLGSERKKEKGKREKENIVMAGRVRLFV